MKKDKYNWEQYKEGPIYLSYDYSELLPEYQSDVYEFFNPEIASPDDRIIIVRGELSNASYKPIIDWYLIGNEVRDEVFSLENPYDVLEEMRNMTKIF